MVYNDGNYLFEREVVNYLRKKTNFRGIILIKENYYGIINGKGYSGNRLNPNVNVLRIDDFIKYKNNEKQ